MSRAGDYLGIPADYVECLDGLRWSEAGDAVETAVGATFAITQEIALFLEGFVSRRPLIHFGHILHLLHMLKRGGTFAALRHAYEGTHQPARNAGAFCALLCDNVPSLADPPQVLEVWHALMSSCYVATLSGPLPEAVPDRAAEMPPLGPLTFEERILRALAAYKDEELHHWFRLGQGPVKEAGTAVARAVAELRPRSLHGVLASLAQRERLAGAVPFVAQLVSALTLPPRRLSHLELPIGGYADVATRGQPEQVLPSQLAVDELEFVRRFAENELLYFRREEPHARLREELVVLLDQGVRAWGTVRLVLSAAFFAFGKLAQRRKLPFQVATTGTGGRLSNLLQADDMVLGEMLEGSDLSPHPGLALEAVLEEPTTATRDVVLLTHPRSLNEADVRAAARRVAPETRLFAVSVDERGSVELAEMRHGTPVSLSRFRVDLTKSLPEPKSAKPVEPLLIVSSAAAWRGDVEPIGYPFRFGLPGNILDGLFGFDGAGEWLLVACQRGMLYACRTDGSTKELLPRGFFQNSILTNPEAVLGITGGIVVGGRVGGQLVAFHYDLAERRCSAYLLGPVGEKHWVWYSVPRARCVVVRSGNAVHGVDLGAKEHFSDEGTGFAAESRVELACRSALRQDIPPPYLHAVNRTNTLPEQLPQPGVCLDPATGELTVHHIGWRNFTPVADGRPTLKDAYLLGACARNNTLALLCRIKHPTGALRIHVYRRPDGVLLFESPHHRHDMHFTLSQDGRLLARLTGNQCVEVRDVFDGGTAVLATPRGRYHSNLEVAVATDSIAVRMGGLVGEIRWNEGRLQYKQARALEGKAARTHSWRRWPWIADKDTGHVVVNPQLANMLKYIRPDPRRFVNAVVQPLLVLLDGFGQIVVLDKEGKLLCMFFVFRSQMAAWMPDGTRYGPPALTGGPETPGAAEKIAQRLIQAVQTEGKA